MGWIDEGIPHPPFADHDFSVYFSRRTFLEICHQPTSFRCGKNHWTFRKTWLALRGLASTKNCVMAQAFCHKEATWGGIDSSWQLIQAVISSLVIWDEASALRLGIKLHLHSEQILGQCFGFLRTWNISSFGKQH